MEIRQVHLLNEEIFSDNFGLQVQFPIFKLVFRIINH